MEKPVQLNELFIFRSVSSSGRQKIQKVDAPNFVVAKEKALAKFSHIRYFANGDTPKKRVLDNTITKPKKLKRMDLVTALERSKKESAKTKKVYYISLDAEDGECSVGTAPIGNVTHKVVNGEIDKTFIPKTTKGEEAAPSTTTSKETAVKPSTKKAATKEKGMATTTKKPANKAAKKVAPKKAAKKSDGKGREIHWPEKGEGWGARVKLSIADQIKKINSGHVVRDPQGKTQSVNYLKTRANQEYVREVYVAKAE